MTNNDLISLTYSEEELKVIILTNLIKMLIERKQIKSNDINSYVKTLIKNFNEYNESEIKIDNDIIKIKFITYKLNSIKKISDIENFMNDNLYKFIIVSNIQNKALKQLQEYKNTEVFYDYELKINLIDNCLVPKHILLSDKEASDVIESYNLKPNNLKRLLITDPVAKYYNMKRGNIVRIERPSINSGYSIDYRIVV